MKNKEVTFSQGEIQGLRDHISREARKVENYVDDQLTEVKADINQLKTDMTQVKEDVNTIASVFGFDRDKKTNQLKRN